MTSAVLLLAHGTPESLEQMPAYLARVRGGRPATPELVEEMRHNYAAIGGRSPLTDWTRAQAAGLEKVLSIRALAPSLGTAKDNKITSLPVPPHGVPGVPSINLEHFNVAPSIIKLIEAETARKYLILPLSRSGATLTVAMVDPTNAFSLDDIKFVTGYNVEPVVASEASLREAIERYYGPTRSLPEAGQAEGKCAGPRVYVGMRNWDPLIGDALAEARRDGVTRLVAVPLAPQYSGLSVGKYREALEAARPAELEAVFVSSWHDHPLLLEAFAEKLSARLRERSWDRVVFTAHSLPRRVIEAGDPYADEVRATAAGVAQRAGLTEYDLAWQSAGRTPEPWLGPSLEEHLGALAERGLRSVLVCPVGFVCDHTEILYDIDVQAAAFARERGLELGRTASLNDSPLLLRALADVVRPHLAS